MYRLTPCFQLYNMKIYPILFFIGGWAPQLWIYGVVKTVDDLADAQLNLTKVTKVRLYVNILCIIKLTFRGNQEENFKYGHKTFLLNF